MSGLLSEIDELYELCVTEPQRCSEQLFTDWAEGITTGFDIDRMSAKYIRRSMMVARKLATFWLERDSVTGPEGWRSRVDVALGARAWRPQLELAEHLLEETGSQEAFDKVVELFPLVRNQPFLDGVSYGAWLEGRARS
jgi:hypothetical protein